MQVIRHKLVDMAKDIEDSEERHKMIVDYVEAKIAEDKVLQARTLLAKSAAVDSKLLKLLKDNFDAYRKTARKFPAKAIENAGVEELAKIKGISATIARTIYEHLHTVND